MTIARILAQRDTDTVTCTRDTTIEEAVRTLAEKRIGALPVLDGGAVVGILSERDIIHGLSRHGPDLLALRADAVMTGSPHTVEPDTPVLTAMSLMTQRRVRHLPVIAGSRMVGFVSIGDLVKHRMDRIESEAEALRTYIQSA